MTALEQKIDGQVKQRWPYIHTMFVYSDGTPMTQKRAVACLWAEFQAKTRNLAKPVILRAELEAFEVAGIGNRAWWGGGKGFTEPLHRLYQQDAAKVTSPPRDVARS
jgi:hypothetical protein